MIVGKLRKVCEDNRYKYIQLGYAEDIFVNGGEELEAVITSRKGEAHQKIKLHFDENGMNVYKENPLGGWCEEIYERLNESEDVIQLNCFEENIKLLHKLRNYKYKQQETLRRYFGKLGALILYGKEEVSSEW